MARQWKWMMEKCMRATKSAIAHKHVLMLFSPLFVRSRTIQSFFAGFSRSSHKLRARCLCYWHIFTFGLSFQALLCQERIKQSFSMANSNACGVRCVFARQWQFRHTHIHSLTSRFPYKLLQLTMNSFDQMKFFLVATNSATFASHFIDDLRHLPAWNGSGLIFKAVCESFSQRSEFNVILMLFDIVECFGSICFSTKTLTKLK